MVFSQEIIFEAGNIILADDVGKAMKDFRIKCNMRQVEIARKMKISPSVLSDYEHGRRPSPGSHFLRRYIMATLGIEVNG